MVPRFTTGRPTIPGVLSRGGHPFAAPSTLGGFTRTHNPLGARNDGVNMSRSRPTVPEILAQPLSPSQVEEKNETKDNAYLRACVFLPMPDAYAYFVG